jgi:NMD protein affecting ribosome stability and mRNA decay
MTEADKKIQEIMERVMSRTSAVISKIFITKIKKQRVGILLNILTLKHFCACPKPASGKCPGIVLVQ